MTNVIRPVLIAGAGPVGSVLALALARSGVAVTLVDDRMSQPAAESAQTAHGAAKSTLNSTEQRPRDSERRPIALSASSARILDTLGIWQHIAPYACPMQMVHVCEQGRFGAVRLRASEYRVPALGYVCDAAVIAAALAPAVARAESITCIHATRVHDARAQAQHIRALFDGEGGDAGQSGGDGGACDARLLVVADGGHSSLCTNLGIAVDHHDYQQMAVVGTVIPERAHQGVAYERFTRHGPLAVLPTASGDCALVWTLPNEQAEQIAALDDADFARALQAAFGRRLGRLRTASARTVFPLALVRAQQLHAARTVLIGNAANRLHPVAGQGLNMGLRDAAVLADLIAQAVREDDDPGGDAVLQRYVRHRRAEHQGVVHFTDALAHGFSAGPSWLGCLRGAGIVALDLLPAARHVLARHSMGLGGPQARLVRGLNP